MLRKLLIPLLLLVSGAALAEAPKVVVSIPPLHSLVAGVMADVDTPKLLLHGGQSPHHYTMRPSEARALQQADVVVWVGGPLEAFMQRPMEALGQHAQVITLLHLPDLHRLPSREGGEWDPHPRRGEADHGGTAHDDHAHGDHSAHEGHVDPHAWLDPHNAEVLVKQVATTLADFDKENAARYAANAETVVRQLKALDSELEAVLAPLREAPFVVFHDAYHYFEARYGLQAVGSVTVSPEQRPGARRVRDIRTKLQRLEARCVFSEPQFPSPIVQVLLEGGAARQGQLDPLGTAYVPGPAHYFQLMRGLAASLNSCLAP